MSYTLPGYPTTLSSLDDDTIFYGVNTPGVIPAYGKFTGLTLKSYILGSLVVSSNTLTSSVADGDVEVGTSDDGDVVIGTTGAGNLVFGTLAGNVLVSSASGSLQLQTADENLSLSTTGDGNIQAIAEDGGFFQILNGSGNGCYFDISETTALRKITVGDFNGLCIPNGIETVPSNFLMSNITTTGNTAGVFFTVSGDFDLNLNAGAGPTWLLSLSASLKDELESLRTDVEALKLIVNE
jgi:hypothetical protein